MAFQPTLEMWTDEKYMSDQNTRNTLVSIALPSRENRNCYQSLYSIKQKGLKTGFFLSPDGILFWNVSHLLPLTTVRGRRRLTFRTNGRLGLRLALCTDFANELGDLISPIIFFNDY